MDMKQTLISGLPELKLDLTEAQTDTLCAFGQAVIDQNQVMNLTAITEPQQVAKLHLLDSLGKRVNWLKEILPQLGVSAQCVTARAEEAVADRRESYDYAVSRAVARLNILLELLAPYVKVGGAVVAMKGSAAKEELAECAGAMKKLGLKQEAFLEFPVDGASHAVIILRKVAPTPEKYPRRYAKIKQSPL